MNVPRIPIHVPAPRPPLPLPPSRYEFHDPGTLGRQDLAAYGGDFAPETIFAAYRRGIFPWPHEGAEYLWFSPNPRAIIPIGELHVSHSLARTVRGGRFRVTLDAAFESVMRGCAERGAEGTWITPALIRGYVALHEAGHAHSFEVWTPDGRLAGGLYGVGAGSMFGAESMFHRVTSASKVAMAAMMQHAQRIGLTLIDVQVLTPHTERMGAIEVSRKQYLALLAEALERRVDWYEGAEP